MLTLRSARKCMNGSLRFYAHESSACQGLMYFSVFLPSISQTRSCPVVYFLSGLSCTEENFMMKAGAQAVAERLGIILVAPDTSPRNRGIEGEKADWTFGEGASFYVNATKAPWSNFYKMYDYIAYELPELIEANFPTGKRSIMGHSMGGHGALIIGLTNPDRFSSISALAPICAPSRSPWGQKAFQGYLGDDRALWSQYDAVELLKNHGCSSPILIDQGANDEFLESELRLADLALIAREKKLPIEIRTHAGYDHSYYFVATFIDDHLHFHAKH